MESRATYATYNIPPIHPVIYLECRHENFQHGEEADGLMTIPLCLSSQPFAQPAVMYLIGPVSRVSGENSLMRVRRSGILLEIGRYNDRICVRRPTLLG